MTMMPSVLVTGADGLVGRAVCQMLERSEMPFVALRRQGGGVAGNEVIHDLTQNRHLVDVVTVPISAVVHLAAAVPMAAACPDSEQMANLTRRMDHAIWLAARTWNCPVLYASTCGLYDRKIGEPKSEAGGLIFPSTPYLAAKLDGEKMFLAEEDALVMRLSAVIGPGQRRSSIVSRFIEAARADGTITLWGSGSRQQNFVDAADVAAFVGMALKNLIPGIFNVAAADPISMNELAHLVIQAVGQGHCTFAEVNDPHEFDRANYEVARAESAYGWRARIPLIESLRALRFETFKG